MGRTFGSVGICALAIAVAGPAFAQELGPGEVLVGASKVSIEPAPNAAGGQVWVTGSQCNLGSVPIPLTLDTRNPWPENPNCIYTGGYGIGPMNPVDSWDTQYGLWSRSVVIDDGTDRVVLTILDGTYYFGRYKNMCARCGAFSLAEDLGAELGIAPSGFIFSATHSHTAPDFVGGWGGVPQWYMDQVTDAMRQSVREAYANRRPATLEVGDSLARGNNSERRDSYHSAEDPTLSWFRAIDRGGRVIATGVAFGAHPTTVSASNRMAHADWHGPFSQTAESRFGGIALAFPGGLGNMSTRGGTNMGANLVNALPDVGAVKKKVTPVPNPDVRSRQTFWDHPVTNSALLSLGTPGLFDRPFDNVASTVSVGKSPAKKCTSTSAISVRTAVSAIRIGNLTITAGPGELFSNLTNTIEEREFDNGQIAMPISIANDGLGYIMQKFEYDYIAGQVTGFIGAEGLFEYEDAYAIDGCLGEKVLEETLNALSGL